MINDYNEAGGYGEKYLQHSKIWDVYMKEKKIII